MCIRDSAYILFEGKVIKHGTSEEIANDPIARKQYPVSYTHLDVYKRQDEGRSRAPQGLGIREPCSLAALLACHFTR